MEVTDEVFGNPAGSLCPSLPSAAGCVRASGAPTFVNAAGNGVFSAGYLEADSEHGVPAGFENGATAWRFYWTAPPAGRGPVTFHIGAVDGNGGLGTEDVPQDAFGDDTVQVHITIGEAGTPQDDLSTGCTLAREGRRRGAAGLIVAIAFVAAVIGARRRNRRNP
jgi:hypothetical protein